ncbi:hypothetical protein PH210_05630 [Paenibacillus sp. BSR1-1]|uniref:hypothetical protein n=1 Tax=Paenibacillus sp. BSR1-1 TaxID=3020845 RepID=UPI0025B15825|nr:hypothetical protein [Paenibacillus sp. BSR1-1]MDN3015689.1 hypothetical protein [Paenibacillus sp. BSR1-1]
MKKTKIIVTIFCLFILIIGITSIYFFAEGIERPKLVLMLGAILIFIQQVILLFIKKGYKNVNKANGDKSSR